MQFHLNGFGPGDPEISAPSGDAEMLWNPDGLPEKVDVLIVGCGPAGLTLAAQLSAFPGIKTRIIEERSGPLIRGHADGVSCRSMEMFQAFGFADRLKKEAY
ncbi:MAG: FAD-dependent monooxygenase, partial [Paracoccaceae bacterium]|nr:FAD-dependent monooxygenase [Paracoccaceae bacterium]